MAPSKHKLRARDVEALENTSISSVLVGSVDPNGALGAVCLGASEGCEVVSCINVCGIGTCEKVSCCFENSTGTGTAADDLFLVENQR